MPPNAYPSDPFPHRWTLTGTDRIFVENNIEGIHLAGKLSIEVVFASGRTPATAHAQFGDLVLVDYQEGTLLANRDLSQVGFTRVFDKGRIAESVIIYI